MIRLIANDPEAANEMIGVSKARGKKLCTAVFNGKTIPDDLCANDHLQALRKEGALLRWVACSLHGDLCKKLLGEDNRKWPEATVFFYM